MKVKIKTISPPYTDAPTASLQAILRNHAHDRLRVRIGIKQLYDIMEELVRRREQEDPNAFRSNEEALADLRARIAHDPSIPIELSPSPGGKECLGNGEHPGYECQCPDCDYYETICFPDWEGHKDK